MSTELVVGGRYRLLERLAVGGMSEVWTAQDLELERQVAVKFLGRDADPERFEREARAAAALSHPNICRLYDYGEMDGRPYIVLELLASGNLEERLATGRPLSDVDADRIARELASALAYAHGQGVVHRDVKPANVLFDEEGRAKLTDFGIARVTGAPTLTEAGTILGTAAYISPEQARGEAAGTATDVYAFGVILYRLLTGRLPFEAEDPLRLAAMHASEAPTPIVSLRKGAPPGLERLAMRALVKAPADRPPDGNALLAGLSEAEEERTEILIPPRGRRIRPRHIAAGAGLAALATAGAALAILATPEPSKAPVTRSTSVFTTKSQSGGGQTEPARSTATTDTTASTASTRRTRTTPSVPATTAATTTPTMPAVPPPPPPPPTTTAPEPTTATTTAATTTEETTTTVSTTTP